MKVKSRKKLLTRGIFFATIFLMCSACGKKQNVEIKSDEKLYEWIPQAIEIYNKEEKKETIAVYKTKEEKGTSISTQKTIQDEANKNYETQDITEKWDQTIKENRSVYLTEGDKFFCYWLESKDSWSKMQIEDSEKKELSRVINTEFDEGTQLTYEFLGEETINEISVIKAKVIVELNESIAEQWEKTSDPIKIKELRKAHPDFEKALKSCEKKSKTYEMTFDAKTKTLLQSKCDITDEMIVQYYILQASEIAENEIPQHVTAEISYLSGEKCEIITRPQGVQ